MCKDGGQLRRINDALYPVEGSVFREMIGFLRLVAEEFINILYSSIFDRVNLGLAGGGRTMGDGDLLA